MNHELRMSCKRGDSLLTNGTVFASCSCGRWSAGPVERHYARILHGTHADSERNDAKDAAGIGFFIPAGCVATEGGPVHLGGGRCQCFAKDAEVRS